MSSSCDINKQHQIPPKIIPITTLNLVLSLGWQNSLKIRDQQYSSAFSNISDIPSLVNQSTSKPVLVHTFQEKGINSQPCNIIHDRYLQDPENSIHIDSKMSYASCFASKPPDITPNSVAAVLAGIKDSPQDTRSQAKSIKSTLSHLFPDVNRLSNYTKQFHPPSHLQFVKDTTTLSFHNTPLSLKLLSSDKKGFITFWGGSRWSTANSNFNTMAEISDSILSKTMFKFSSQVTPPPLFFQFRAHLHDIPDFSFYNGILSTCSLDCSIKRWDLTKFDSFSEKSKTYSSICLGHTSPITKLVQNDKIPYLSASGSMEGSVMIWDSREVHPVSSLNNLPGISSIPNGPTVLPHLVFSNIFNWPMHPFRTLDADPLNFRWIYAHISPSTTVIQPPIFKSLFHNGKVIAAPFTIHPPAPAALPLRVQFSATSPRSIFWKSNSYINYHSGHLSVPEPIQPVSSVSSHKKKSFMWLSWEGHCAASQIRITQKTKKPLTPNFGDEFPSLLGTPPDDSESNSSVGYYEFDPFDSNPEIDSDDEEYPFNMDEIIDPHEFAIRSHQVLPAMEMGVPSSPIKLSKSSRNSPFKVISNSPTNQQISNSGSNLWHSNSPSEFRSPFSSSTPSNRAHLDLPIDSAESPIPPRPKKLRSRFPLFSVVDSPVYSKSKKISFENGNLLKSSNTNRITGLVWLSENLLCVSSSRDSILKVYDFRYLGRACSAKSFSRRGFKHDSAFFSWICGGPGVEPLFAFAAQGEPTKETLSSFEGISKIVVDPQNVFLGILTFSGKLYIHLIASLDLNSSIYHQKSEFPTSFHDAGVFCSFKDFDFLSLEASQYFTQTHYSLVSCLSKTGILQVWSPYHPRSPISSVQLPLSTLGVYWPHSLSDAGNVLFASSTSTSNELSSSICLHRLRNMGNWNSKPNP